MQEAFIIKYNYVVNDGFDLAAIGESFIGFDALLKDILDSAYLKDVVEVKTTRVQQGSIEVYNALLLIDVMPFNSVPHFLEFLRIAAPELLKEANTFFSVAHDAHRSVNDYFARNPVDMAIGTLIIGYILGAIRQAGKLKYQNGAVLTGTEASPRQLKKLKSMIEHGRYRRALKPITEGNATSIKITPLVTTQRKAVLISEANVGNYLPEENKILPELKNGDQLTLTGELVTLQSMKGDVLKIKVDNIDPQHSLLIGHPADGTSIEDYKQFFKQSVIVTVEISRKTMYKRPELIIQSMALTQEQLPIEDRWTSR